MWLVRLLLRLGLGYEVAFGGWACGRDVALGWDARPDLGWMRSSEVSPGRWCALMRRSPILGRRWSEA